MKKTSFLILLVAAACAAPPTPSRGDQVATVVAGTLTARPAFTPIPSFTAAVTSTSEAGPAAVPENPFYTFTRAQNVNLRTRPGTLFPVSRVMAQGTRLQVLGLSPGGEWASVLNDEGINGWVDLNFVDEFPREGFAVVEPTECQKIVGHVLDSSGGPVSGIGFAVVQTAGGKTLRTDAATDSTGTFYAYLPATLSGVWTVGYVSIAPTSNAFDAACANDILQCGYPLPESANISLPLSGPLNFTWSREP